MLVISTSIPSFHFVSSFCLSFNICYQAASSQRRQFLLLDKGELQRCLISYTQKFTRKKFLLNFSFLGEFFSLIISAKPASSLLLCSSLLSRCYFFACRSPSTKLIACLAWWEARAGNNLGPHRSKVSVMHQSWRKLPTLAQEAFELREKSFLLILSTTDAQFFPKGYHHSDLNYSHLIIKV